MIDIRSDTFTVPDEGMREAMATAVVGDDVFGEDPTTNALQDRMADMFGVEAALFVPSGTQGNQICIALHTDTGEEVIAEADAHIFHYENAATSVIARGQIHRIPSYTGAMPIDDIRAAIRPPQYYYPRTAMIAVENTHNRHGGTVLERDYLHDVAELARERGIAFHCDGARLWHAMVATGTSAREYGMLFDTISICLSKGLGAPVGSVILSTRERIEHARRWRKMLGGGMRQSGMLAAAGLYALDHVLPKLEQDHAKARRFAELISVHPAIDVDLQRVQTNIVVFRVAGDMTSLLQQADQRGVRMTTIRPGVIRVVMHHQISMAQAEEAALIVREVLDTMPRL